MALRINWQMPLMSMSSLVYCSTYKTESLEVISASFLCSLSSQRVFWILPAKWSNNRSTNEKASADTGKGFTVLYLCWEERVSKTKGITEFRENSNCKTQYRVLLLERLNSWNQQRRLKFLTALTDLYAKKPSLLPLSRAKRIRFWRSVRSIRTSYKLL